MRKNFIFPSFFSQTEGHSLKICALKNGLQLMREEIWTEKIFKDDAGYFLRINRVGGKC